ncbi:MAG: selenide, water dikinase SelD [Pseudomonadota bacterium]
MMKNASPVTRELVLIGGGHSHVAVLKKFGMNPLPGVRITLITRDVHTPYSGMLPGFVAGHYDYDECHIDLRPLANFAGARIYHDTVTRVDADNREVHCAHHPPIRFDALSINSGSRPNTDAQPGVTEHALPVKPVDAFLSGWEKIQRRCLAADRQFNLVVVGGGAGGVELSLAMQHRLNQQLSGIGKPHTHLKLSLLTDTQRILPTHNAGVRQRFEHICQARNINVLTQHAVTSVTASAVHCEQSTRIPADAIVWVTQAAPPEWVAHSDLELDEHGFIAVDKCLQSLSHPDIFAVGDVASVSDYPRPKSGVFAVRQGPPLAENLYRVLSNRSLKPFKPQTHFLSLISTGDQYAVASRSNWSFAGAWVWRMKNWIDQNFMRKYREFPPMSNNAPEPQQPEEENMRCGGCGAKIGGDSLSRVLAQLRPLPREDVVMGLHDAEDAAAITVPTEHVLVQSVDYFRAFIDDPWLFGQVAANHSLNDVYAMGAKPQSAVAIATLPYAAEHITEADLFQLMSGALKVLNEAGATLLGGHSSEGAELAFGLTVNGLTEQSKLLRKSHLQPGDQLLLIKPLGTGTLFAADMQGKTKGRWVDDAITSMLHSNAVAADIAQQFQASACTDITGFGLVGHLLEMLRPAKLGCELTLDELPIMTGALDTMQQGFFSSLQPSNERFKRFLQSPEQAETHAHYPLLFDPQTAGGLLLGVSATNSEACLKQIKQRGYLHTRIIGSVTEEFTPGKPVRIR